MVSIPNGGIIDFPSPFVSERVVCCAWTIGSEPSWAWTGGGGGGPELNMSVAKKEDWSPTEFGRHSAVLYITCQTEGLPPSCNDAVPIL